MRKRILSLFLAIVMVVLAVPTLAIVSFAEEIAGANGAGGVVYSTSFSSDPKSENYPTVDLPAATEETTYAWNGLDITGLGKYSTNEAGVVSFTGGVKYGAVTYHGGWEMGTIGVTWDPAGTAAPVVNSSSFYRYNDFYRATEGAVCITTGTGIWGTSNVQASGGFWLLGNTESLVAGIVYDKNPNKETDVANERIVTGYVGTSAVRYTAEYTGIVDISVVAGVAYRNGIDLVVLHNGQVVHTVANKTMATRGSTDFGTVKETLAVQKGDTLDFVSLGDVNYDYDSFAGAKEAAGYEGDFDYQKGKRGVRNFQFDVEYTAFTEGTHTYSSAFGPKAENYPVVDLTANTITYPDAWSVGAFEATAQKDPEVTTDWGEVTVGTKFTPYNKIDKSAGHALTHSGSNTWGSTNGLGGALWLGSSYTNCFSVGANYTGGDPRTVTSIYSVPGAVYTAEYAGDVTVSVSVDYTLANGTRLLVRHNGVDQQIFDHGTKTATVTVKGVLAGDAIEFVCIPDLNFDADSYEAHGYDKFLYSGGGTHAKMGVKLNEFAVSYADAGFANQSQWTGAEYELVELANKIQSLRTNPDYFLFRWYTAGADGVKGNADDVAITKTNTDQGAIAYAKINPSLMSKDTANILPTDTYEQAFDKYAAFLKSFSRIDYTGDWSIGYDRNGKAAASRYLMLGVGDNPFMLHTDKKNQIGNFAGYTMWVDEQSFDEGIDSYYNSTFYQYDNKSKTNYDITVDGVNKLSFTEETLVADIEVTYNNTGLNVGKSKGWSGYEGAKNVTGESYTYKTFYLRPANYSTTANTSMLYTASGTGRLSLSLNSLQWYAEDTFPYASIAIYKNGKMVPLNFEGLNLTTLASAMPDNNNANKATANTTAGNLQALEKGLYYDNASGYLHIKLAPSDKTKFSAYSAYTVDTNETFFQEVRAIIANTVIDVAQGDVVAIRVNRSNAYDSALAKYTRPTDLRLGLTANLQLETASVGATLEMNDAYAMNLYITPMNKNAAGVGVFLKNAEGNLVGVIGDKQTNGSYKVTVAKDILINELAYFDGTGYAGGVAVTYIPYEYGEVDSFVYEEKTLNTVQMLESYISSGRYDTTTVELAKAVRALAAAVNYEKGLIKGAAIDGTIKNIIKGDPKGTGTAIQSSQLEAVKNALYGLYPITSFPNDIIIKNKTNGVVLTSATAYSNYGATLTNMMLQAYQDYLDGDVKTLEEGYWLDITFPTGATKEANGVDVAPGAVVRYYFPYALLVEATKWGVDYLT